MAIVNSFLLQGLRGRVGDLVFKQRNNKTYVSRAPQRPGGGAPTAAQQAVREKFKRCSEYAKAAIGDPVLKAEYASRAKRGQSAYNVAFKDATSLPKVLKIGASRRRGRIGSKITVCAQDDFQVKAVRVFIFDSADRLIEEGEAMPIGGGILWVYRVGRQEAKITGVRIRATAIDLPGNQGSLEIAV